MRVDAMPGDLIDVWRFIQKRATSATRERETSDERRMDVRLMVMNITVT